MAKRRKWILEIIALEIIITVISYVKKNGGCYEANMFLRLTPILLFLVCLPCVSQAASFDCAKAASPMEKAICSDPQLSRADEDLQKAYEEALKPLSQEGQTATRTSQRTWLAAVRKVCHLDGSKPTLDTTEVAGASCMQALYQDRLKQLKSASSRIGPFQFYKISVFKTYSAPEDWQGFHDVLLQEYVTFRIENPANDAQKAWNKYMASLPQGSICDDQGEHSETSTIVGARSNYISVVTEFGDYCGGAHGEGGSYAMTRLLDPARPVTLKDVFLPGSEKKFGEAAIAAIYNIPEDERPTGTIDQITLKALPEAVVNDINRGAVSISASGLGVYFTHYEFGTYLDGIPKEVIIPWDRLKPILNPNSPIKLPPDN